jgi:hypothetical protein
LKIPCGKIDIFNVPEITLTKSIMATGLNENASRLSVFIKLGGHFFPPRVIPDGYLMGTQWVSQEKGGKRGAQFLCHGMKPTDESFTEIWDFLSSCLGVPYFCL